MCTNTFTRCNRIFLASFYKCAFEILIICGHTGKLIDKTWDCIQGYEA